MRFSLKPILAALVIGVTMAACNFGNTPSKSTNAIAYQSTDLLMRLDANGSISTPEPPKIQAILTTDNDKSTLKLKFSELRLNSGTISFATPELPITFTETGMEARQIIIPISGSTTTIDNFLFQVNGNWMTISMEINNENVRICSSWVWSSNQLYNAGYIINDLKSNLVLLGGTTNVINPATGQNTENKNAEYGIYFDAKTKTAGIYSFFTSLDGNNSATKTYLIPNVPYTLEANGIKFKSNGPIIPKDVTKYESKDAPEMTVSSIEAYIPYTGLKSNISFVMSSDNITVSCNELSMVQQITMH